MLKQVQHDVEWGAFFGSWHGFSRPGCRFSRVGMGTNFRRITRSEALLLGAGQGFLEPGGIGAGRSIREMVFASAAFSKSRFAFSKGWCSYRCGGDLGIGMFGGWLKSQLLCFRLNFFRCCNFISNK